MSRSKDMTETLMKEISLVIIYLKFNGNFKFWCVQTNDSISTDHKTNSKNYGKVRDYCTYLNYLKINMM